MEIRKCNEKDIDEIYELICELESERFNYKEFEEAYKNKIIDEKNHYFLIIKDNKIIGLIILIIDYQLHPFAPMLSKIGKKAYDIGNSFGKLVESIISGDGDLSD